LDADSHASVTKASFTLMAASSLFTRRDTGSNLGPAGASSKGPGSYWRASSAGRGSEQLALSWLIGLSFPFQESREHGASLVASDVASPGAFAPDQASCEQVLRSRVSNTCHPPIGIRCKAKKQYPLRNRKAGDRFWAWRLGHRLRPYRLVTRPHSHFRAIANLPQSVLPTAQRNPRGPASCAWTEGPRFALPWRAPP
jgi:hypothetical protein